MYVVRIPKNRYREAEQLTIHALMPGACNGHDGSEESRQLSLGACWSETRSECRAHPLNESHVTTRLPTAIIISTPIKTHICSRQPTLLSIETLTTPSSLQITPMASSSENTQTTAAIKTITENLLQLTKDFHEVKVHLLRNQSLMIQNIETLLRHNGLEPATEPSAPAE